jgi:hypothetical protein
MEKELLKKKTKTTVTVEEDYILSKTIGYKRIYTNNKLVSNTLYYKGAKVNGYNVIPMWKPDLDFLKKWNPYWGEYKKTGLNKDYSWFNQNLPEPQDIDIKEIILCQSASHSFFELNLDPIPVVIIGDYIEAGLNNVNYHLKELKTHFETHKNIVECSDILDIPYYNVGKSCGSKYLHVIVYPEAKWLKELYTNKQSRHNIFTKSYLESDYLEMLQFAKPKIDYEE